MALTDIDLCSKALIKIGANTIASFDEETKEAEVAGILYEHVKNTILSSSNWGFAVSDVELAQLVDAPIDRNYSKQYAIPTDWLNTVNIYNEAGTGIAYAAQGGVILTNTNRAFMKYVADVSIARMPNWFVEYLIAQLAFEFCEPIRGDGSLAQRMKAKADESRRIAYKMDSRENVVDSAITPSIFTIIRSQ